MVRRGRYSWLGTGCALALVLAGCAGEEQGPVVRVQVPPGASFAQATDSLFAAGVIARPKLFRAYARARRVDQRIRPGTYGFRPGTSWSAILSDLRTGRVLTFRLVIPEGWDLRQIADRLGEELDLPAEVVFTFLSDTTKVQEYELPGPGLEGYLFPATYTLPVGVSLEATVAVLVDRYRQIWTPARLARADSLQMSEAQVVTLASIIEREAKLRDEMPLISGVFHNRLRIGMPLQADATVQYALGSWQERLLTRDLDSVEDHPYSTYHRRGLPPGPIGSPGETAIDAALDPARVDYLYFVARPDGSHIFSRTNEEHNRARARARELWAEYGRSAGPGDG